MRSDLALSPTHALPPVVVHDGSPFAPVPATDPHGEAFVSAAGHAARLLPAHVHDALVDFVDQPHRSGALLLKGMPIGELPLTPATPTTPTAKDHTSEFSLLTVARRLGQPVGYEPEHGGDIVQNLVPVQGTEHRQVSTSSKVELMFHTEAAFHPHRPRYLLLICLRGDPSAITTLSSIHEVLPHLAPATRDVLFEPRFRTAVDESYLHGRQNVLGAPMPVLSGDRELPTMVFDADLMVGTDEVAEAALLELSHAVEALQTGVALEAGDLLVVDNAVAVHGRSPYSPRFDGTDRWLQRAFVVSDLRPSAAERQGRVITTVFGA
ncbi:MAG: TauD/TfdA family dioxygenase [Acidimicrobiales bacterium]